MQRVTNCVLEDGGSVLLLQKPSRNWWVAPGGKMEQGESVREAVVREFWEETGLIVKNPHIRGIFTFLIIENDIIVSEWMMFTFAASTWEGLLREKSPEGNLAWQKKANVPALDMAPGDKHIFQHVLGNMDKVLYGTFRYTPDYKLLDASFQADEASDEEGMDRK
ncbi:NUDIX domain-containing protein [Alteribacillus sp. HJP-4]|uniref:NUDIX hydrolase n=1 Tax=Alteribacillus sp. HJP-4 TaxID=2775394 RepID=UPI0035CCD800